MLESLKEEGMLMNKKIYTKVLLIIIQIGLLYGLNIVGNLIVTTLSIPIPGSILGLLILLVGLYLKIIPVTFIQDGAGFILVILPLFFIPSTVGIIQYPELLSPKGFTLILMVMVSTFITMIVVGRVSEWESKRSRKEGYKDV